MVDEWLRRKGTVLWGIFDVSSPDTRAKAVDWFITEMDSFDQFLYAEVQRREARRSGGNMNPGNPVVRVTATSGGPQVRGEIVGQRFGEGPYSRCDFDVVCGDDGHLVRGAE